jgi:hypothetical protein
MNTRGSARLLVLALCAALSATPVLSAPPEWAGHGKGDEKREKAHDKAREKAEKHWDKQERKEAKREEKRRREDIRVGGWFNDNQRVVVRNYYSEHYSGGRGCPPGLAKKHNNCVPPGQAKKYIVGQPLRVQYYTVPRPVLVTLPPAPVGYRYVTVNGDILLVAIGTMIVVDALTQLLN